MYEKRWRRLLLHMTVCDQSFKNRREDLTKGQRSLSGSGRNRCPTLLSVTCADIANPQGMVDPQVIPPDLVDVTISVVAV